MFLLTFMVSQKSLSRATVLKTLSDIIIYRRVLSKNRWNKDRFDAIMMLWQQAANIYSDKVGCYLLLSIRIDVAHVGGCC